MGRLYTNTLVDVDMVGKEWTKVSSGNCEGYVQTQCLCFGEEAEAIAEQIGTDNLLAGYKKRLQDLQKKQDLRQRQKLKERLLQQRKQDDRR